VEHCRGALGRAIADLPPGEWIRKAAAFVNEAVKKAELGPVKGQSMKRRLDLARDRLVHRPGTIWDYDEGSWIRNAEAEHHRERFAAIISPAYQGADNSERRYHPDELNETVRAWNTSNGIDILIFVGRRIVLWMPSCRCC
jgi:hypothetical protein